MFKIYEIRAVIKYFCKKGIPPKEMHEDFKEIVGKRSLLLIAVEKWAAEFMRGGERALRMVSVETAKHSNMYYDKHLRRR